MSFFHDNALIGSGSQRGYQIERSLRFNSADSAYLNRTPASAGNRKIWTWSGWVKRTAFASSQAVMMNTDGADRNGLYFNFTASDTLQIGDYTTGFTWQFVTTQVFRDPSAWFHVVFAFDSTQATSSDRAKLYVNGSQVTALSTASYPSLNYDSFVNTTSAIALGRLGGSSGWFFNGYLTEIHFIDGQALTPSSFGETDTITGVWKPKKYAGTYGTNGFYLKFADNSGTTSTTLGKDSSGNGNNWTPNNFSVTAGSGNDSMIDTPTPYADGGNGRGNYCTLSPLSKGDDATLANGNLDVSYGSAPFPSCTMATFGMSSGKWYWETTITASSLTNTGGTLGVTNTSNSSYNSVPQYPGYSANGWSYSGNTGTKYNNGTSTAYGSTFGVNDVIGCAFDADTGKIWWSKNGTWQASGDPAAGTNAAFTGLAAGTYFPAIGDGGGTSTFSAAHNFGQRAFAYTPPAGFLALNTQNLPEPSIKKPSSYMDVKLYTGNGGTQTISGLEFSPDLAWIKSRSNPGNGHYHHLVDAVRGSNGGFLRTLYSNTTEAEDTYPGSTYGGITSLNANGFSLANVGASAFLNNNTTPYVAWCWDESATPGFDIVTYTGNGTNRTIAHSLGVAPSMIIVKDRTSGTANWVAGHTSIGWGNRLYLNDTSASTAAATTWNSTAPTSSVFSVGTSTQTNANGDNHVAYLWSEVAGFSKFGSYTGNGSSDGPFVFTGHRSRWILGKRTDSADEWWIYDTARSAANQANERLLANSSGAELTTQPIDILSNGFKVRSTSSSHNASGGTYVFAAFSESAFKYSLAR